MAIDKATGIDETLKAWGSDDAQRADGGVVLDKITDFNTHSGEVILQATSLPLDDPKSKAWIEEHKAHLLPRKFEQDMLDLAFADGNLSARARVLAEHGQAKADEFARAYGLRNLTDPRKGKRPSNAGSDAPKKVGDRRNPWLAAAWSITEQGRIVRQLGETKAAQIAAAAGCRIGSVRPNANYN